MVGPETLRRLRWHAGLDQDGALDGRSVSGSTLSGSAVDEAVASFLKVLELLNHELNGATPSEIVGTDAPDVSGHAAYAVAEVASMLRESGQDEAAWQVDTAWRGVLAGDIDDIVAHVDCVLRARRSAQVADVAGTWMMPLEALALAQSRPRVAETADNALLGTLPR